MIEAELKARVPDTAALRERLERLAPGQASTYRDIYYDTPRQELTAAGRELRVRVVETGETRRAMLTYKGPPADQESQSKPEHETTVGSPGVIDVTLSALGLCHLVAFDKHCVNFAFAARGRELLATLVTVPEIDGTFIELETMAEEPDLPAALLDLHAIIGELGIRDEDLTTEQYTDAVMRARA
jgi:adenylate cyclase, class 2